MWTRPWRATGAVVTALCVIGCGGPSVGRSSEGAAPGAWSEFAPARVRIHPLTRLAPATPDHPARIDAHIELLDRWGLPVRALGELRFIARLHESDAAVIRSGDPDFDGAIRWSIDMTDPEENATRYFDRVTRTYHIALSHAQLAQVHGPLTLEAIFAHEEAAPLPATTTLTPP